MLHQAREGVDAFEVRSFNVEVVGRKVELVRGHGFDRGHPLPFRQADFTIDGRANRGRRRRRLREGTGAQRDEQCIYSLHGERTSVTIVITEAVITAADAI